MIPQMRQSEKTVSFLIKFFIYGSYQWFVLVNAEGGKLNKGCFECHKQYRVFCLSICLTKRL